MPAGSFNRQPTPRLVAAMIILGSSISPAMGALPLFTKVTLAAPAGDAFPTTFGTNSVAASGAIGGFATDPTFGYAAVRFGPDGSPTRLDMPGVKSANARARSISGDGNWSGGTLVTSFDVFGNPNPGFDRPVRWDAAGTPQFLKAIDGTPAAGGSVTDVNDSGQAIGLAAGNGTVAFVRWEADGSASALALPGVTTAGNDQIKAINNAGTVVGIAASAHRAVRWDSPSSFSFLLTPSSLDPDSWTNAFDINSGGQIVGYAHDGTARLNFRVLWDAAGNPTVLPAVPGYEQFSCAAYGVDDFGHVIGSIDATIDGTFTPLTVVWDTDGTPYLLSSLLADPTLRIPPRGIGSYPTIAADANGIHIYSGVILTAAIPEPSPCGLVLGAPLVLHSRKRRRTSPAHQTAGRAMVAEPAA